ncbi:HNH endonuclease [Micrococcaceae bacterium RIT802]|nr:HNH endonuclease [Micrococcaceae bacterium RIT 802]
MDNGLSIRPWAGRARSDALALVKRKGRAANAPCSICGQPIDYSLVYPHKQSCSVQHIRSRRDYPELTWEPGNWAPAHLDCNKSEGTGGRPGLGVMGDW